MGKLLDSNVLYIGDTHIPFEHRNYLEFVKEIQQRVKCGKVVLLGDLVDNHAISYHEHDPNGWSPADEMRKADKRLKSWFKAFPELLLCRGNHDSMVDRKGKTVGLPRRVFRPFRDIWGLPKKWIDDFEFMVHGVRVLHGTGYKGKMGHVQAAYDSRCSAVIGHIHSVGGVEYIDTRNRGIFGMATSCGIDRHTYAMAYGKDDRFKPILGCGITTDYGKYAQYFPMVRP